MASEKCERCDGTGIVFTTSLLGRDDKDTCPECGGEDVVEPGVNPGEHASGLPQQPAVVPHYQWTHPEVLTLRAEVERLKTENAELRTKLVTLEAIRRGVR